MFELNFLNAIILVAAGFAAGFINVTAGGGSMFTVPVMTFMGMPTTVSNATNRVGVLFQSLSAVYAFYRKGFHEFKLSFTLALCTLPGAIFGAFGAAHIRDSDFDYVLAGVMCIVMLLTLFQGNKARAATSEDGLIVSKSRFVWGHICMVFVGLWGGFIQIGAGFILIPILNRVMGFDLLRTNMHKITITFIYTIVALAVFASQLEIEWGAGLCITIGTVIGAWIGTQFQITRGTNYIKWVINTVLIVFIIKLIFF